MDLSAPRPWWPLGDIDQMGEALRHWIAQQWSTEITVREWWHRLAAAGLTAPTWPRAHGGLASTTVVQRLIEHALAESGTVAPPVDNVGFRVAAPALRQYVAAPRLATWLPELLCGESVWTILVDEAGVDDPALTSCAAVHDWGTFTVTGTKRYASGVRPTHAITLVRTGPAGRAGLTVLAIDLGADGVAVDDGEVQFDGARYREDSLLGRVDGGWSIWNATRPYLERSLAGRIRRGLARATPGPHAGDLERLTQEILDRQVETRPPGPDRRAQ